MGKYAATRSFQRDRQRSYTPGTNTFSSIGSYLSDLPQDEAQFKTQAFLYGFDPTGLYRGYINSRDSSNYWKDYFANTGLTWSDIKYPSKMYGFGSEGSTARTGIMLSKNLFDLYK